MLAGAGRSSLPRAEEGSGVGWELSRTGPFWPWVASPWVLLPPAFSGLNQVGRLQVGQSNVAHYVWSKVKCQSHGDIYFNWCGEENGFWPLHNLHYCKQNLLKLRVQGFSFCVYEVYLDSKSLTFSVQDYFCKWLKQKAEVILKGRF